MLDKGYLSSAAFYASTSHSRLDIEGYREAFLEAMFVVLENFEVEKATALLRGPAAETGFKRLN